jgi:hypothetical protein
LGAVRCNDADGQRGVLVFVVFSCVIEHQQLGQSLQQQVSFFGVGRWMAFGYSQNSPYVRTKVVPGCLLVLSFILCN